MADRLEGDDGDVLSISLGKNQLSDSWVLDSATLTTCVHIGIGLRII